MRQERYDRLLFFSEDLHHPLCQLPTDIPPVTREGDDDSDEGEEIPLPSNDPVQPQPAVPALVPKRPQRTRNRPPHLRDFVSS